MSNLTHSHSDIVRVVNLLGYPIVDFDEATALGKINELIIKKRKVLLGLVNANFAIKCENLKFFLKEDRSILFNDGIAVHVAAKILSGHGFKANLNTTDLMPKILFHIEQPMRVAFIGGEPGVASMASQSLLNKTVHQSVMSKDGFNDVKECDTLIKDLYFAKPDLVLVALGNPKQEQFLIQHWDRLPPALYCGVGALLDFSAGKVKRAPKIIRKCRAEWAWRLIHEPNRLIRRYSIDMVRFFLLILKQRMGLSNSVTYRKINEL